MSTPEPRGATADIDAHLDHVLDGDPVYLPYADVGHFPRTEAAASPQIEDFHGVNTKPHPFSGKPMGMVETRAGGKYMVDIDRLAHAAACRTCAPIWQQLEARFDEIPDDAAITAGLTVNTSEGPALLLVDVDDLPEHYFQTNTHARKW